MLGALPEARRLRQEVEARLKTKNIEIALFGGFLLGMFVAGPRRLLAQTLPGPMIPPEESKSAPTRPAAKPKPPAIQTRTTLDGAWKLNRDESDDPNSKAKIKDPRDPNGGNRGGGYPGGGYPGGGGPMGGGYPFPGSGRGGAPRGNRGQNQEYDEKLLDLIRPSSALTIALKNAEVDVTDDGYHKLVFYTDGRQLQKPKDDTYQEVAARWNGNQLISDEKTPQGAKMSRTFELSQNGQQLYETLHIDAVKSKPAVYISYVYDIPPPQATHETDPDQPVMKRRSDNSDSASPQGTQTGGAPDPNQPVLKRKSDDSDTASTPQPPATQPTSEPDPDQPVMKRRSGNNSSQ